MSPPAAPATLDDARVIADATRRLTDAAIASASALTAGGDNIDLHQVLVDRVAYAATEARAATEVLAAAEAARAAGRGGPLS